MIRFNSSTEIALYLLGGYRPHIQGDPEYQQLQHQLNYYLKVAKLLNKSEAKS